MSIYRRLLRLLLRPLRPGRPGGPRGSAGTRRPAFPECLPPGLIINADVVVVDVETTGWLADAASITEIGAIRVTQDGPGEEFSALVNPGKPIPAAITELTGISDDMVRYAPGIGEVLPKFLEFADGCLLVAHNAPFDLGFLTAACAETGIAWPPCAVIDTAVLARLILRPGEVPDHKLTTLAAHFGTRAGPSHRALADAKATAGVLTGLLSLLSSEPLRLRRSAGAGSPDPGGGYGHSDCPDQGGRGAHPGDGRDDRPDY